MYSTLIFNKMLEGDYSTDGNTMKGALLPTDVDFQFSEKIQPGYIEAVKIRAPNFDFTQSSKTKRRNRY